MKKTIFVVIAVLLLTSCSVADADQSQPITANTATVETEPTTAPAGADDYGVCIEESEGVTAALLNCSASELERQDARLNAAYKVAMDTSASKSDLRDAQRQWIKFRDAECTIEEDGGTAASLNHVGCLLNETQARADKLEAMAPHPAGAATPHQNAQPSASVADHAPTASRLDDLGPATEGDEVFGFTPPKGDAMNSAEAAAASAAAAAAAAEASLKAQRPAPIVGSFHSEIGPPPNFDTLYFLTIQSVGDSTTINSVELNRGNCQSYPYTSKGNFPVKLRFGEDVRVQLKGCRSILEAVAHTDAGSVIFEFSPGPIL